MYNKEKAILYHWSCAEQIQYYKFKNKFDEKKIDIVNREYFDALVNQFRSPHLWVYENGKWELRHKIL